MGRHTGKPRTAAAEVIFTAALSLPPAERPAYVAAVCGGDSRLRHRVEALLAAHLAPQGFLPEEPGASDRC